MSNLSPSTLALLRAAKNDAPSKESRHAIWGGVTSGLVTHTPLHITPQGVSGAPAAPPPVAPVATSAAPAAAAAKSIATTAGLTGMKGAFVGALFGSAISIGVATFMLRTKPVPTLQNETAHAPLTTQVAAASNGAANGASNSNAANLNAANMTSPPTTELDALPISANAGSGQIPAGSSTTTVSASHTTNATTASVSDDTPAHATKKKSTSASPDQNLSPDEMLSRETALVVQANRELRAGDAAAALKTARTARALEARQFEPEEMKAEAAALRLLGRDSEAAKVESQRRSMYPNAL